MKAIASLIAGASALALVTGCAGMPPSQRNAAVGGALGAAAGAAVSDDDTTGALIGGALGAAAGYYTGCREQGGCYIGGQQVASQRQFDAQAGRYYFRDPNTGATYWEDGRLRTRG
jgi:hypothetical protein